MIARILWVKAAALLGASLLVGCATTTLTPIAPKLMRVQEPPVGDQARVEIGDTLVRTAKLSEAPAIRLLEALPAKGTGMAAGNRLTLPAGLLVAKYRDGGSECYMASDPVPWSNFMATGVDTAGLCLAPRAPKYRRVVVVGSGGAFYYEPTAEPKYEAAAYVNKSASNFSQELIYNGKTGDTVKFLYREFIEATARPAFDQQVEYDLRDGAVIGFKGARVEIIEANNTSLQYRVLAHFPFPD